MEKTNFIVYRINISDLEVFQNSFRNLQKHSIFHYVHPECRLGMFSFFVVFFREISTIIPSQPRVLPSTLPSFFYAVFRPDSRFVLFPAEPRFTNAWLGPWLFHFFCLRKVLKSFEQLRHGHSWLHCRSSQLSFKRQKLTYSQYSIERNKRCTGPSTNIWKKTLGMLFFDRETIVSSLTETTS